MVVAAVAAAAGAVAGYRLERALLGDRLDLPPRPGPDVGAIDGERIELGGPDGVRVTVERYGPADAPQIVLAHGWTNTGRVWHEQITGLANRYRLITYDQPGHGRTSRPRTARYDLDLFGDTLATVIDRATEPGPLVLVGHSLGGMTVLNFCRRHGRVRHGRIVGALLLSTTSRARADDLTFGFGIHTVARIEFAIRHALRLGQSGARFLAHRVYQASTDLSFVMTRLFGLQQHADPRHVDFTEQLLLDSDFEMVTGMLAPMLTLDEDDGLLCLDVPTVIACGTKDKLTPVELSRRMARRQPSATLLELAGIGHMAQLEAAPAINAVIEQLATGTA